jgi:hypothetical protein
VDTIEPQGDGCGSDAAARRKALPLACLEPINSELWIPE